LQVCKSLICNFPRNTTIEQELVKYRLLNIFYNRDAEIRVLKGMAEEEQLMKEKKKAFRNL